MITLVRGITMNITQQTIAAALTVLLYNPIVWEELINNDPKAFEQARANLDAKTITSLIVHHMKVAAGAKI